MITESMRRAFAEFEGYEYRERGKGVWAIWKDGRLHSPSYIPTYDNETDLFRLIRKMDDETLDRFICYLDQIVWKACGENGYLHRHRIRATPAQLAEAIFKAIGGEGWNQ